MKLIFIVGEYLFATALGTIVFFWLQLCTLAELPGLPRYLRMSRM